MAEFAQITPLRQLDLESVNLLVTQLVEANAQMALAISEMKGADGQIPRLQNDLDLNGHRIINYGNGFAGNDLVDIDQLRANSLYAEREQEFQTRRPIVADAGVRVPYASRREEVPPMEQVEGMMSDLVHGPATSTNNAIARWDGTTGRLLQDSTISSAIADLTDSTGATANNTVENVPAAAGDGGGAATVSAAANVATVASVNAALTAIENNIADLTAKVNAILAALRTVYVIAT